MLLSDNASKYSSMFVKKIRCDITRCKCFLQSRRISWKKEILSDVCT